MYNEALFSRIIDLPHSTEAKGIGDTFRTRAFFRGALREAKFFTKSKFATRRNRKRFLIVSRARSGSKLLTRLLDSHSKIHCDREIFNRNVIAPAAYFDNRAATCTADAYGAKILTEQMIQAQRMHRPDQVLRQMVDRGVHLIHLERGSLMQTISGAVAHQREQLHSDRGGERLKQKVHLDPEEFLFRLRWRMAVLEYEKAALAEVPHLEVSYERDLIGTDAQNQTVARICDMLELNAEVVAEPLQKLLPHAPQDIIENFDEIFTLLTKHDLAHLVPD